MSRGIELLLSKASACTAGLDDFIPLPPEDADPVVDAAAAAIGHGHLEEIANLRVTEQPQTTGEECAARLADPGIVEAAGQRPREIANAGRAFPPDARAGPER